MWRYRLHRLAGLAPSELLLLLRAQWALLRTVVRLRLQPPGRIVAAGDAPAASAGEVDPAVMDQARAIERAVMRAARHGLVRPLCLGRAMALQSMLEARKIGGSRVRVGVQMDKGEFAAHAWVEFGGRILGDSRSNVSTYVPLDARIRSVP